MAEPKSETVVFNGMKFYRYPTSTVRSDRKYFRAFPIRGSACVYLHRAIWEHHNGEIPERFEIHHIDENTLNNSIDNLECIHQTPHQSVHAKAWFADPDNKAWSDKHLEEIRPLTKKWHASEEGHAWHAAHAKEIADRMVATPHICEFCGDEYPSVEHGNNRFCSNKCKSAARRASGVDDVDRVCVICGNTFRINKYSKTKTCTRKCGGELLSAVKKEINRNKAQN